MDELDELVLKTYFHSFDIPSGMLMIYGDNMIKCASYINNTVNSVEDICIYCKKHDLRIFHKTNRSITGFIGLIRTCILGKKYGVYSSWNDVVKYILITKEKINKENSL